MTALLIGWRTWLTLGALLALTTSAVLPARGWAGTYTVSACRAGWTPEIRRTSTLPAPAAYDYCGLVEHGLKVDLGSGGATIPPGDYAGWRFDAPPDTAVTTATVSWLGLGDYATASWGASAARLEMSTSTSPVVHYQYFNMTDTVSGPDASWVRIYHVCVGVRRRVAAPWTAHRITPTSSFDEPQWLSSTDWRRSCNPRADPPRLSQCGPVPSRWRSRLRIAAPGSTAC
jgi:hypothetical protein